MSEKTSLLEFAAVAAGYLGRPVLQDVCLNVSAGEIVAVLGPNGAGKSTLLRAAFGLLPLTAGEIWFRNNEITNWSPNKRLNLGISYVMQGNRAFDTLTVEENLETAALPKGGVKRKEVLERALEFFPALRRYRNQRASILSAGEKQMLALARGIVQEPQVLLLDEPTCGLAPNIVVETFMHLLQVCRGLHIAVLIVEQNVNEALKIADRAYVLRMGKVVYRGSSYELVQQGSLADLFLGRV